MSTVDMRNFTRRTPPVFPYAEIAKTILPKWDISLVYAGTTRAQNLNRVLRKKEYVPNVLSYESGTHSGEIIICLEVAQKQAPTYGLSYKNFAAYLFIHGLLHLKGLPHGTTMERYESQYLQRFMGAIPNHLSYGTTHRNRNRHRNTPNKNSGGGRSRRA